MGIFYNNYSGTYSDITSKFLRNGKNSFTLNDSVAIKFSNFKDPSNSIGTFLPSIDGISFPTATCNFIPPGKSSPLTLVTTSAAFPKGYELSSTSSDTIALDCYTQTETINLWLNYSGGKVYVGSSAGSCTTQVSSCPYAIVYIQAGGGGGSGSDVTWNSKGRGGQGGSGGNAIGILFDMDKIKSECAITGSAVVHIKSDSNTGAAGKGSTDSADRPGGHGTNIQIYYYGKGSSSTESLQYTVCGGSGGAQAGYDNTNELHATTGSNTSSNGGLKGCIKIFEESGGNGGSGYCSEMSTSTSRSITYVFNTTDNVNTLYPPFIGEHSTTAINNSLRFVYGTGVFYEAGVIRYYNSATTITYSGQNYGRGLPGPVITLNGADVATATRRMGGAGGFAPLGYGLVGGDGTATHYSYKARTAWNSVWPSVRTLHGIGLGGSGAESGKENGYQGGAARIYIPYLT